MKKAVVLFTIMALVVSGAFATAFISVNDLEPEKVVETKEIRLSLNIDTNDFNTKIGHALRFLKEGNKVKVSIRFRGREMAHTELGVEVMKRFAAAMEGQANIDKQPKLEGRSMQMFLSAPTGK